MKEKNDIPTTTNGKNQTPPEGFYTPRQVAEKTGLSLTAIERWARKLKLPLVNHRYYVTEAQLNSKIEAAKNQTPPEGCYTTEQAAKKTGRQKCTIARWAQKLKLPLINGRYYITEAQLNSKIEAAKNQTPPEGFYTITQVAEKTGLRHTAITNWARKLKMPLVNGRYYITEAQLNSKIETVKKRTPPEGFYTPKQVAEKTGRNLTTIRNWVRELEVLRINGRVFFSEAQLNSKIEAAKKRTPPEGSYTIKQAAEKTGRSPGTIRNWAKKLGVPLENRRYYFTEADIQTMNTQCSNRKRKDITGKKHFFLTAIRDTGKTIKLPTGATSAIWEWQCECGNTVELSRYQTNGSSNKSCGCRKKSALKGNSSTHSRKTKHYEHTIISRIEEKLINKNNTTGVRGVQYVKKTKKYRAVIKLQKRFIYLGSFKTLEEAATARKAAEETYFQPIIDRYYQENPKE